MMYYAYVLRNEKDGHLYVGYSSDLAERIQKHDDGKVLSTKNRLPMKLVCYGACYSKDKAIIS